MKSKWNHYWLKVLSLLQHQLKHDCTDTTEDCQSHLLQISAQTHHQATVTMQNGKRYHSKTKCWMLNWWQRLSFVMHIMILFVSTLITKFKTTKVTQKIFWRWCFVNEWKTLTNKERMHMVNKTGHTAAWAPGLAAMLSIIFAAVWFTPASSCTTYIHMISYSAKHSIYRASSKSKWNSKIAQSIWHDYQQHQ